MTPSIAFILIATGGPRYTQYLDPLVRSIEEYMPPDSWVTIFQEQPSFLTTYHIHNGHGVNFIEQPDLGWPRATLMRYHAMLKQAELLRQYSHVFYMDVDMLVCKHIGDWEICSDGITAVTHPGFPDSFERNPRSTAYVPISHDRPYYQGCFVGGRTDKFLAMCETITGNIDRDDRNGIVALWHDESHLNRYLIDNPPAKVLSPAYAFPALHYLKEPEKWMNGVHPSRFEPKIRHLEKTDQGSWKNAH